MKIAQTISATASREVKGLLTLGIGYSVFLAFF